MFYFNQRSKYKRSKDKKKPSYIIGLQSPKVEEMAFRVPIFGNEFVLSDSWEGKRSPEFLRSASSTIEEVLVIYKLDD